jgi:hypothetical protein
VADKASGSGEGTRLWSKGWRAGLILLVFAAAIYESAKHGEPSPLPGPALGWVALFHVERAAVLLGAAGIVLLIGWRAIHGDFPIKFGNIEYAVKDAAAEAKQASALQERRIRVLEVLSGVRAREDLEDDQEDA